VRTIRIVVAYDGTDFVGWQRQAKGRSVQGLLEEALARIDGTAVTVVGAGRTDAGVHALGQAASFSLAAPIDLSSLQRALNAILPCDVRAVDLAEAEPGFNARFGARSKTYRYQIVNARVMSPFLRRYAWHVPRPLDLQAMSAAAGALEGRHDFASFQAAGSDVLGTVRTLSVSRWVEGTAGEPASGGPLLTYEVRGDGFLRHMVRNIVGTLVEIGVGRRRAESVEGLLASRDRGAAGPTAPAHGLWLVAVEYDS
jgi:tRNA pseudouridine38-40 synthase